MMTELGHLALLLAGSLAGAEALLVLAYPQRLSVQRLALRLSTAQFWLLFGALLSLAAAFARNDFSLAYVAAHSNSLLPWYYRLSAVWGGHEGSLLLWIFILGAWTLVVARQRYPSDTEQLLQAKVLAVLAFIQAGFIAFIALTSNPFRRAYPVPFDGADLNPLLQDIGLIFHPPLLYTGYVGFALAFAFVVASLWQGDLPPARLRQLRPWTLWAWLTLTLGIALGSYWAYYELGWGGWWFWDPVENASLMPWLVGAALVHALLLSEKRQLFLLWTALLAIVAFALSLMGTFLVRSGILTSVHAFASDPSRGLFILALLVLITLPALLLLIVRAPRLLRPGRFRWLSREMGLLLNNWLLLGACLVVLLGTLYPLIADLLQLGKISVGAPYFNRLIVPLALLSLLLLALAPLLRWQRDRWARLRPLLLGVGLLTAGLLALSLGLLPVWDSRLLLPLTVALLALASLLVDYGSRAYFQGWRALKPPLPLAGMLLSHLGYIVLALAISLSGLYSQERDLSLRVGQTVQLGGYDIQLLELRTVPGPNYVATEGKFLVRRGEDLHLLRPSKRQYFSATMPLTESARLVTPSHDLYLALGEALGPAVWAVRLQYKPFIVWIWLGALIMALGGALSAVALRRKS